MQPLLSILLLQIEGRLTKNMAQTSGALMCAKMLRERIQTPWEKIRLLFDMSVKSLDDFQWIYEVVTDRLIDLENYNSLTVFLYF